MATKMMGRQPRTRHTGRRLGWWLRSLVALGLSFYLVYTPIHLVLEPHSTSTPHPSASAALGPNWDRPDAQHGEEHADAHPASQHLVQATPVTSATAPACVAVLSAEPMAGAADTMQHAVIHLSGLSPPELQNSWQFLVRAALPVRAPSPFSS